MVPIQLRFFVLLSICSATGCHPWYLVESRFQQKGLDERPAEVTATATYLETPLSRMAVAVQAPDECADLSAAEASGKAAPAGELLRTTCGVEMAELERALAKAGQRVVSWTAVREMVRHEANVTPLEASRRLGAGVLLQINSLERSVALPGHDANWNREFYESDRSGKKGPIADVPEARAQALEREIRAAELAALPHGQVSATINATCILVSTGEAIWFYEWTHSEAIDHEVSARQLLQCNRRHLHLCFTRPLGVEKDPNSRRSGGKGVIQIMPEDADQAAAAYYALVKVVLADLVSRFVSAR